VSDLSVLITGYGSIGRRLVGNLRELGVSDITVYRTGHGTLPANDLAGIAVETDLSAALARRPTAVFVVNPTARHIPTALAAARAGCHLFLEKPISHNLDGVADLQRIVDAQGLVCCVGFQFRFHPGLREARRLLRADAIGRMVSVRAHWGEYLPDWHPWEDYRRSYSALNELGGGVTLTLCHPFDYLRWLVGEVIEVSARLGYDGLDIEAEDTADVQLAFESRAIASVHLDYVQRPSQHQVTFVGLRGTLHWDNQDGAVRLFQADRGEWQTIDVPKGFDRNTMFLDETRHFLECVAGTEAPVCTLDDGVRALKIALAAKQSAVQRRVCTL
jgi:predicted dehydrogenase